MPPPASAAPTERRVDEAPAESRSTPRISPVAVAAGIAVGAAVLVIAAVAGGALPFGGAGEPSGPTPRPLTETGLGLTATELTTALTPESAGGYTFEDRVLSDGRPRIVGVPADRGGRIVLVGPPEDVQEVTLDVPVEEADRLTAFATAWFPDTAETVDSHVRAASGRTEQATVGGIDVTVRVPTEGEATLRIARN
jgi:hypothetical protein